MCVCMEWNIIQPLKSKMSILLSTATWMYLGNSMFSEISERQILYITYMWNLKNNTKNVHKREIQTHRHRKQTYGYQRAEGWKEDKSGERD